MITIARNKKDGLTIDNIYKDNRLQFEQSNLTGKNRFGSGIFKANNGKVLTVNNWVKV